MSDTRDSNAGTLWVVATPIGNLGDFSPRGLETLASANLIAAEDTRITRRLISDQEIHGELISLHEHNESRMVDRLIERLLAGEEVALVSDAGTPLVSDPGYRLVAAAHDAGIPVRTVPGPCAAVAALSVAGLPTDRFWFEGFLPAKTTARKRRLGELAALEGSLVFYAPARDLPAVLADLAEVLGSIRMATLGRELTKLHETVRRDSLKALAEWVAADPDQQRGEAVVVVSGSEQQKSSVDVGLLAAELARELPPSRAAKVLARLTDLNRSEAWEAIESVNRKR